ncbi:MAG: hypothetical protein COB23_03825 [Methylophaga sp.]|nr:MAG: hypothetical protein COB23_03825 [Methylophaga sp.]
MSPLSSDNSNEIIRFDSRIEAQSLALQLVQQASREICFFGNTLDSALFDNTAFIDAISEFARRNHRTQIHFVVHNTQANIVSGHKLILLAQQLTSAIHIHISAEQHQHLTQMFLLVDNNRYLYCPNHQSYQGRACIHDPLEVRSLKKTFDNLWAQSTTDSSIRRLGL